MNKGYTHVFILEFATQEDYDYYIVYDKAHHAFSATAGPLVEDQVISALKDGYLFGPAPQKPSKVRNGRYEGSCHCGDVRWTAKLDEGTGHILRHCQTCRKLGGGPYSLNQIIARNELQITRGQCRVYTYTGASGVYCLLTTRDSRTDFVFRKSSRLLLLSELYVSCVSSPRGSLLFSHTAGV